jgi:mycothiol synthase
MPAPPSERVQLCPEELRREALSLLYRRVDDRLRDRIVADALAEVDGGVIDLSGLWVAHRRERLVGTLLTQPLAGRAAAIWAPEILEGWGRSATARGLLRAAIDHLRGQGVRIAQALLDESAPPRASADLARGGLPKVTTLEYLECDTTAPIDGPGPIVGFDWRPFGPETEADFRGVLQATYAGSLDMPELEGVRSLDDVIAGHRAAGRFDPSRWLVGRVPGDPAAAAVVLLSEIPDRDAWEVAYLGLTLPARGRGLGRAALEHARQLAAPHARHLELAVDRRNTPAARLYHAAGFRSFDRRAVHLAVLNR